MKIEVRSRGRVVRDEIEIELDPESRGLWEFEVAVNYLWQTNSSLLHVLVSKVVEVLLDLEVGRAGSKMQVRGSKDLAGYIVRSDKDVMSLGRGS